MPSLAGDDVNIKRSIQENVKKEDDVSLCLKSPESQLSADSQTWVPGLPLSPAA